MTDDINEEQLNDPANIQPENSSDEIILTTNTEPVNQNQDTENMEHL